MARKGNGYVALTATGGVEMVTTGRTAQREVRAAPISVWLVQMGRAAEDGTFAQFVEKILGQPLQLVENALQLVSLRGQEVRFQTEGALADALTANGESVPLSDYPHIASIYGGAATLPVTSVEVRYQEHAMRLNFDL
jgi:hypothetical protein